MKFLKILFLSVWLGAAGMYSFSGEADISLPSWLEWTFLVIVIVGSVVFLWYNILYCEAKPPVDRGDLDNG